MNSHMNCAPVSIYTWMTLAILFAHEWHIATWTLWHFILHLHIDYTQWRVKILNSKNMENLQFCAM